MLEQVYQGKIMDAIIMNGGHVVNGVYTRSGEADLQCGYPVNGILRYLVVEVKTEEDYSRVMSGVRETGGRYRIVNIAKLKEHEAMQIKKLNIVRDKGGLAILAYNYSQVKEYVEQATS